MDITAWAAEVAKAKRLRKWGNKHLADATGYSHIYIRQLLSGFKKSRPAMQKINEVLGITMEVGA